MNVTPVRSITITSLGLMRRFPHRRLKRVNVRGPELAENANDHRLRGMPLANLEFVEVCAEVRS